MHIEDNSYPSPHDNSQRKKTLKKLIEEAIKDEILDSEYFSLLSDVISDSQDKHTILNIRMDEEKHQNLLGGLYSMLTGNNPPEYTPEDVNISENIPQELYSKIIEKTDSVDFYTRLLSNLTERGIRDILIEIISDEAIHADLLNALFSKYKVN